MKDTKTPPGQARYLRDVVARIEADDRLDRIKFLEGENARLRAQVLRERERRLGTAEAADDGVPMVEKLREALGRARRWQSHWEAKSAYNSVIYSLWQEDVIDKDLYDRYFIVIEK